MGKLHELLAVEAGLRATKEKAIRDAVGTFVHKSEVFTGYNKDTIMFDEARGNEGGVDAREVVYTVNEFIEAAQAHIGRYWNLRLQKERANQAATADVVVDGLILFSDVPVTYLLNMEQELTSMRQMYENAPTLANGLDWQKSDLRGDDYWQAEQKDLNFKTEKTVKSKVLTEATQYFPAQIEKWSENKNVARIKMTQISACISSADKHKRIANIDRLIRAFKQARQRANGQESVACEISSGIFNYINS